MKNYTIVSFSGGKDSTAMLLHMIELGEHIDEVICCDTYMEFPAMYRHIAKVKKIVEDHGIKFTELRSEKTFEYYMFEYELTRGKYKGQQGYGWALPTMRWCTGMLKRNVVHKYLKSAKKQYNVIQCVGIAFDEGYRLERKNNQTEDQRHPLIEWKWTEEQCLKYCYSKGFDWEGLYEIFRKEEGKCPRVSCWCCPLQSLTDLRVLRRYFPSLWAKLRDMDKRARLKFKSNYSVEDLEIRFALEEEAKALGLSITNREFHNELKKRLGR